MFLADETTATTPSPSNLWGLLGYGLDTYRQIEAEKLRLRLVQAENKQLSTIHKIERASNIDAVIGNTIPIGSTGLSFSPQILILVVAAGLLGYAAFAAVKG